MAKYGYQYKQKQLNIKKTHQTNQESLRLDFRWLAGTCKIKE